MYFYNSHKCTIHMSFSIFTYLHTYFNKTYMWRYCDIILEYHGILIYIYIYIYIYINWKDCFKNTQFRCTPSSSTWECMCVCVCVCVCAIDAYTPFLELVNPYCQVKRAHCSLWGKKLFTRILDRSKMLSLLLLWHYLYPNDQRLLSSLTTPHLYHILPFSIYPSAFL